MNRKNTFLLLGLALVASGLFAQGGYTNWIVGDTSDVSATVQAGAVLAGGGGDNDEAMQWMLQRAGGGDVLVLRASGSDGYNSYFYSELGVSVNSVETIRFDNASAANDPYVLDRINKAELLFFAGGDQYDYYQYWKGTPIGAAINAAISERGITVGGTSAGMMVLGEAYYAPSGPGIVSAEALGDPFHPYMSVLGKGDFLQVPFLQQLVTDTHFDQRERDGRLMAFMARLAQETNDVVYGIAANEYVAVCIDENGLARVFGEYPQYAEDVAYFLQVNCENQPGGPESCTANSPLDWQRNASAVKVLALPGTVQGSNTYDLSDHLSQSGGTWAHWYVAQGQLQKVPDVPAPVCNTSGTAAPARQALALFPNPLSGRQVQVHWPLDRGPESLRLFDATGRAHSLQCPDWQAGPQTLHLPADLAAGLYHLDILAEGQHFYASIQLLD